MKVKCVSSLPNKEQAIVLGINKHYWPGKEAFAVEIGKEYIAYSLFLLDGVPWIDIERWGFLLPTPLCLFEIIDPRVSKYWEIVIEENGDLRMFPREFLAPYFHDDLSEKNPEIVKVFQEIKQKMDKEALL